MTKVFLAATAVVAIVLAGCGVARAARRTAPPLSLHPRPALPRQRPPRRSLPPQLGRQYGLDRCELKWNAHVYDQLAHREGRQGHDRFHQPSAGGPQFHARERERNGAGGHCDLQGRDENSYAQPEARHLHVLLLGTRPSDGRHAGHAHGQLITPAYPLSIRSGTSGPHARFAMGKQQASADGAQGCIVSHARAFALRGSDVICRPVRMAEAREETHRTRHLRRHDPPTPNLRWGPAPVRWWMRIRATCWRVGQPTFTRTEGSRRRDRDAPDGGRAGVGWGVRHRTPEGTEGQPKLGRRVGSSGGDELQSVSLAR